MHSRNSAAGADFLKFLGLIDRFNTAVGKLASMLIWAGIIVLCWEVVARYVFGSPTIWAHGYTQRIFGTYFMLIGAYTLVRGDHVRIDLLLNTRSPRLNAALDILNYAFLIVWGTALAWEGFWLFEDAWRFGEADDSILRHPMWPIKFMLFAGAALITLQGLVEMARSLLLVFGNKADVEQSVAP